MRERKSLVVVAPVDDGAVDPVLVLGADVEEARALRRAQPLVAVAGVEVGAEPLEVERRLTRRVRAVDDDREPFRACAGDDRLDRQEQGGRPR